MNTEFQQNLRPIRKIFDIQKHNKIEEKRFNTKLIIL